MRKKLSMLLPLTLCLAGCGSGNDTIPGTNLSIEANLDETTPVIDEGSIPFVDHAGTAQPTTATSFADIAKAASFSATTRVFDSAGFVRTIEVYFFHIAPFEFEVRAYVISNDVTAQDFDVPQLAEDASGIGEFVMTFDPSSGGRTNDPDTNLPDIELIIPWSDFPTPQEVNLYFTGISAGTDPAAINDIKAR